MTYSASWLSAGFFSGQWHDIHPQYWTKFQVWEWLQQFVDTNQLDASCIPFQEFDITGEHLCSMTLQDFTQAAGAAGHILYSNVQNLKWHGETLDHSQLLMVFGLLTQFLFYNSPVPQPPNAKCFRAQVQVPVGQTLLVQVFQNVTH